MLNRTAYGSRRKPGPVGSNVRCFRMRDLPCPCCGFLTLEDEYGSFAICPVCDWEDDGVQLANPTSSGGANSKSLAEAQDKTIENFPCNIEVAGGFRRSNCWRPLNTHDIAAAEKRRALKHWHSHAVLTESETYWQVTVRDIRI